MTAAGAEAVRGDLLQPGDWEKRLTGCISVFHVAGEVAMCDRTRLGSESGGNSPCGCGCGAAGVRRIVFTSSAATIGEAAGTVGAEATVHTGQYLSGYARSKHLAEQAAFSDAARLGIELVSVNPSSIQGPGRTHGTARIFLGYLRGKLRWAVRTRMPLVFVDDAVNVHLLAEDKGVPGSGTWRAGGHRQSTRWSQPWLRSPVSNDGCATHRDGCCRPRRHSPSSPFVPYASTHRCAAMSREVRRGHVFDGSRAERELGLRYTAPEEWLAATVEWYREQGLI